MIYTSNNNSQYQGITVRRVQRCSLVWPACPSQWPDTAGAWVVSTVILWYFWDAVRDCGCHLSSQLKKRQAAVTKQWEPFPSTAFPANTSVSLCPTRQVQLYLQVHLLSTSRTDPWQSCQCFSSIGKKNPQCLSSDISNKTPQISKHLKSSPWLLLRNKSQWR